jgi:polysaccharide biosynthesis transport protein
MRGLSRRHLPPGDPAAPRKKMILIMAAISGLGFGLMLAFLKEYYFGGVVSASQLQNIMQVRVPVTVQKALPPESGHCADLVIAAPMSPYSESFRKLRASIDMGAEFDGILRDEALVVLVCSALQAEGKTTSAISLARTYALSGANTLLIDADLRKPNVERTTGCRSEVGFLDYLMAWGTPEG